MKSRAAGLATQGSSMTRLADQLTRLKKHAGTADQGVAILGRMGYKQYMEFVREQEKQRQTKKRLIYLIKMRSREKLDGPVDIDDMWDVELTPDSDANLNLTSLNNRSNAQVFFDPAEGVWKVSMPSREEQLQPGVGGGGGYQPRASGWPELDDSVIAVALRNPPEVFSAASMKPVPSKFFDFEIQDIIADDEDDSQRGVMPDPKRKDAHVVTTVW